jgi:hypothetical protein
MWLLTWGTRLAATRLSWPFRRRLMPLPSKPPDKPPTTGQPGTVEVGCRGKARMRNVAEQSYGMPNRKGCCCEGDSEGLEARLGLHGGRGVAQVRGLAGAA